MTSALTSQPPPGERVPLVVRLGSALGVSAAASLVCAVPASVRLSGALGDEANAFLVWVSLAGAAIGPMTAAVLALRGARDGLRPFGGQGAWLRAYGAALWTAAMLVALSLFGSVLRATTHHHALAGVTFAFGALAIAVGAAAVCARIVAIARRASPSARHAIVGATGVLALAALAWLAMRFFRAASHDEASSVAASGVIDSLAFAFCALFASRRAFASKRAVAIAGPALALAVALFGGITLATSSAIRDAAEQKAPAFGGVIETLSGK